MLYDLKILLMKVFFSFSLVCLPRVRLVKEMKIPTVQTNQIQIFFFCKCKCTGKQKHNILHYVHFLCLFSLVFICISGSSTNRILVLSYSKINTLRGPVPFSFISAGFNIALIDIFTWMSTLCSLSVNLIYCKEKSGTTDFGLISLTSYIVTLQVRGLSQ